MTTAGMGRGMCMRAGVRLVALGVLAGAAFQSQAQVVWTIQDLGTLGGAQSSATDINDIGWVCGTAQTASGHNHAYRWSPQFGMLDLGTVNGGTTSYATAISDAPGPVAVTGESNGRAFRHTGFTMRNLGTLGGSASEGNDISPDGRYVTGRWTNAEGNDRMFRFDNVTGIMQDLGHPEFQESASGMGINNLGQIAAWGYDQPEGYNHTYLYGDHVYQYILPLWDSWDEFPKAINATGVTVGHCAMKDFSLQAYIWPGLNIFNDRMEDIGSLGGTSSIAHDINRHEWVVGEAHDSGNDLRAFLWRRNAQGFGVMEDLNHFLPNGSGWVLTAALGINDRGQIVGEGLLNGVWRGFLMTPTFPGGVLLVNDSSERRGYLLDPTNGDVLGSFPTLHAVVGQEYQDYGADSLLLSDPVSDTIWFHLSDLGPGSGFLESPYDGVNGIVSSLAGYVVGATPTGLRAWDRNGVLNPVLAPGHFTDVTLVRTRAVRFYLASDFASSNVKSFDLDLNQMGETASGGLPSPRQIAVYQNNARFAVASYDGFRGRISKFRMSDGAPVGSFTISQGVPSGVHRLGNGEFLVSTSTGLHTYLNNGTLWRTIVTGSGFGYISRCRNVRF